MYQYSKNYSNYNTNQIIKSIHKNKKALLFPKAASCLQGQASAPRKEGLFPYITHIYSKSIDSSNRISREFLDPVPVRVHI